MWKTKKGRKKGKNLSKEYDIDKSPFTGETRVKTRFNLKEIQDSDTDIVLARKRSFKSDEYVKQIITPELNLANYYSITNLAKTLLHYITQDCLDYNTCTFKLDIDDFMRLLKFNTKNRVYDAIRELIEKRYIAKTTTREIYWINHNRYYKGNFLLTKTLKIRNKNEYLKDIGLSDKDLDE